MRYTGTYTARAQAQSKAILRQTVKRAQGITNPEYMKMLFDFCTQLQHIDTGRASQAEEIRNSIHIWTAYHKDLEELKLMRGLIFEVATMKARKAERAARWAKKEQEYLQKAAQATT